MATTTNITGEAALRLINQITDDIRDTADLPDNGIIDALNLLVNAFASALGNGGNTRPLSEVVEEQYSSATLDEVIGWIHS